MKDYHFPWAIIGEPTDMKPCMKHYGYIEIQILTRGKRVHASLANLGNNAIESMLKLLLKISAYLENNRNEVVYNIRELSSSRTGFVVPDRCEAWLDLHIPPSAPEGEIMMEIEEIIGKERQDNINLDVTMRFTGIHRGYEIPEKGLLIKNLKDIYSKNNLTWEPDVFRSHSDANILWASGVKPLLLGAGQLEQAHTAEESIHFKDVCTVSQIYLDLLLSL
jgi:acetylornithine deacetylase